MDDNQKTLQSEVEKQNTMILGEDKALHASITAQLSAVTGHYDKEIAALKSQFAATESKLQTELNHVSHHSRHGMWRLRQN